MILALCNTLSGGWKRAEPLSAGTGDAELFTIPRSRERRTGLRQRKGLQLALNESGEFDERIDVKMPD